MNDQLNFFNDEEKDVSLEKKKECRYHRWANELDFIEYEQKNGKKVIKCRFCVRALRQNKEEQKKQWEWEKEHLTDYYIRRLFVTGKGNKLPMHEYPEELIQVKRAILQLKREEKEQEESKEKIVKTCVHHGKLTQDLCIKAGTNHSGTVRYKCRQCNKENHARHYEKNKEKIKEKTSHWAKNNRVRKKELNRKYRQKMDEMQYVFKRITENKYRERNREKIQTRNTLSKKYSRLNLTDQYVRQLLYRNKVSQVDIPEKLVEAKRSVILLKRAIKERKENEQ